MRKIIFSHLRSIHITFTRIMLDTPLMLRLLFLSFLFCKAYRLKSKQDQHQELLILDLYVQFCSSELMNSLILIDTLTQKNNIATNDTHSREPQIFSHSYLLGKLFSSLTSLQPPNLIHFLSNLS